MSRVLEFDLLISGWDEDGGMGDTQSVSSLSGRTRKLVEERIHRDVTNIKGIVAYDLKKWGNRVIGFKFLPPDTVRLLTKYPITPEQRLYLGCEVVDADAAADTWMEGDLTIIHPGEDKSYPRGAELLVVLKDDRSQVYNCDRRKSIDDPGSKRSRVN